MKRHRSVVASIALILAVSGVVLIPPKTAAAGSGWYACQTVTGTFQYRGRDVDSFDITVKLQGTGCWDNTGSTWRTGSLYYVTYYRGSDSGSVTEDGPGFDTVGSYSRTGAGSGPYKGFTLWWANYLDTQYTTIKSLFGWSSSTSVYGIWPRLELHPSALSSGGGWRTTTLLTCQSVICLNSDRWAYSPSVSYGPITVTVTNYV